MAIPLDGSWRLASARGEEAVRLRRVRGVTLLDEMIFAVAVEVLVDSLVLYFLLAHRASDHLQTSNEWTG